jgi:acetate---CoA ligase (ADP-forming)
MKSERRSSPVSEEALARHPLDAVLSPRSLAVVGASADPKKRGNQVLAALRESGYAGAVYPVNPKGGEILGFPVFRSIDDLPSSPDLALICTPAETVAGLIEACGRKGVRGVVVLAVGFGETGDAGREEERRMLDAARRAGVRIVGPNTSGILNLPLGLNLIGARGVRAGGLSLLVQSGNMALSLMNEVTARSDEGIAICVGVGNQTDLGFADYLDYLGRHEETRVIVVYAEAFHDARAFLETAAGVSREKPVVLVMGARSDAGRAAARSHTGAVAGSYDRLRAGLAQAGVVELRRTDEVMPVTVTLAGQPAVAGQAGVVILSDGGGQGALAADDLSELGIPLTELGAESRAALEGLLGPAAAVGNPVDLAGAADADPGAFARTLEILATDPSVGGVLVVGLFGGYGIRFAAELTDQESRAATAMAEAMSGWRKPLVVHSMYATSRSAPLRVLTGAGVPVVESLEVACRCIAESWNRGAALSRPRWDPAAAPPPAAMNVEARIAVARSRADGRDTLTEIEAQALLRAEGIDFPGSTLCVTPAEAAAAVEALARPAALKVVSARIPHKTDAGGVVLDVASPEAGAVAFEGIERTARAHLRGLGLPEEIDGVIVSPMFGPPLAELLVGACRDPGLGPVLTLGAGGVWVEALGDVVHRVLPLDDDEIRRALTELRAFPLLTGARGRPVAHIRSIVDTVRGVAHTLERNPQLEEVEVNPLFVYADTAVPIDARVFLTPGA